MRVSIGSAVGVRVLAVIALLIFVSQLAAVLVAWRSMQSRPGAEFRLPLPDRVVSIVEIVEATPPEDRDRLLEALNSPNLAVRIEPVLPASERTSGMRVPMFRQAIGRYSDVLKDREVIGMIGLGEHDLTDIREDHSGLRAAYPMRLLIELHDGGWLVVETPDLLSVRVRRLPFGFLAGLAGTIVASLAVWGIWQEVRPVRDMAKAARRFAESGQPSPVVPAGGRDMRALTASFNAMQERIAALIANRTLVMSAMTHDVRTYLTRLRLRIEALEPKSREAAERTLAEIQALLDDTLAFAEADSAWDSADPVDLAALLDGVLASGQFPEGKVRLVLADHAIVPGHAGRLQRALVNLISNAVKYGSEADVALTRSGGRVYIAIADRGPGIPVEDRKRVFDPFYRRDASRNRNVEGAGLGLAIAHNVIRSHGGTITLTDRPGGGLVATIDLPIMPASAAY